MDLCPGSRARNSARWARLLAAFLVLGLAAACAPAPKAPATAAPPTAAPSSNQAPTTAPAVATAPAAPQPAASSPTAAAPQVDLSKAPVGVDADGNFYRGDPKAPVKLTDFSDFQ